jgi:hypothetical protein
MFRGLFDGHTSLCVYPTDISLLYAYYPDFVNSGKTEEELLGRIEKLVFDEIKRVKSKFKKKVTKKEIEEWRENFLSRLKKGQKYKLESVPEILGALAETYPEFDSKVVEGETKAPEWTVFKETSIEIYAHELLEWFPEARFIHLVRDPRDTYAALSAGVDNYYSHFGEDEHVTLFSLLNRLGTGLKCGLANRQAFGEERYRVIHFEEIVSKPRRVMEELASWLDIEFQPTMTKPTKMGEETTGNSFEEREFREVSDLHKRDWSARIADRQAQVVEFYLSHLMSEYGYEPAFSLRETREAAAEFYKWSNYKYFYFDSFGSEERKKILE